MISKNYFLPQSKCLADQKQNQAVHTNHEPHNLRVNRIIFTESRITNNLIKKGDLSYVLGKA